MAGLGIEELHPSLCTPARSTPAQSRAGRLAGGWSSAGIPPPSQAAQIQAWGLEMPGHFLPVIHLPKRSQVSWFTLLEGFFYQLLSNLLV